MNRGTWQITMALVSVTLVMIACDVQLGGDFQRQEVDETEELGTSVMSDSYSDSLWILDPDDPAGRTQAYAVPLYAARTAEIGQVVLRVEESGLVLSYSTSGDRPMREVHAWVGRELSEMPQTRTGNPKVGRFPYKAEDLDTVNDYAFPLSGIAQEPQELCGATLYAAAHAAVEAEDEDESAWAGGERLVERGNWATYFSVELSCADLDYDVGDTGPAGGVVFLVDAADRYDWTYLEVAPAATEWTAKPWGGEETTVGAEAQHREIGAGASNTEAIVAAFGDSEPSENRSDYAAKLCQELTVTRDGVTYDDWFLPSSLELRALFNPDIAPLVSLTEFYWSSSEHTEYTTYAWFQYFGPNHRYGWTTQDLKNTEYRVRAVRAF